MLMRGSPTRSLRSLLALLACMVVLLSGVAQQRAFAAKTMAGANHMQLCLQGDDAGEPAPGTSTLHDCFECCLGTYPALPCLSSFRASVVEWQRFAPAPETILQPQRTIAVRPPSRGPPDQA
jgi:hypothetical protein